MNLEDFKSFCRVLIPSEVGSIPTHSRHPAPSRRLRDAGIAVTAILVLAAAAVADEGVAEEGMAGEIAPEADLAPEGTSPPVAEEAAGGAAAEIAEEGPRVPGPLERAFRSALFPAWGQLTNGKSKKAVVLFSVQSYICTRIVLETRRAREARRRADRLAAMEGSDPAVTFQQEAAEASAQQHFDRRRDLLFWALVGGFYGAMDAYIDAHLGEFDRELEEGRSLFGEVDPVQGHFELGMRF